MIGRVIRSIHQEDRLIYPIETLQISVAAVISDGWEIYRTITSQFEKWYKPETPPSTDAPFPWRDTRDRLAFNEHRAARNILLIQLDILWTGLTWAPHLQDVSDALVIFDSS